MAIYHTTTESTAGHITLLDQYESKFIPNKHDETSNETIWFPDVNDWEVESIQRMTGNITKVLASKWSVERTMRFYRRIERKSNERISRGFKKSSIKVNGNNLDLGVPFHVLIESANLVYGFGNWMNVIDDSIILEYEKKEDIIVTLILETKVKLILADNTVIEKTGIGSAYNLNRELAFRKCKKESVSDAMKNCFAGLVVLLFEYENGVRSGFYDKYQNI
jgi:recombination DNA repair RAD52 pathway protein